MMVGFITIPQYWLFKGKVISETYPDTMGIGMNTRLPPSDTVEVESSDEKEDITKHKKLPWSIAEGERVMTDKAMIAKLTTMKGFFKKTPSGEYLIIALHDSKENTFIALQFLQHVNSDLYVVGIVGAVAYVAVMVLFVKRK